MGVANKAVIIVGNDRYGINELLDGRFRDVVYEPNRRMVYSICLRMLRNAADAEDVAQETFENVYKSLHRFRGESALSTWIYKIAQNHCKNRIKYKMRKKREVYVEERGELEEIAEKSSDCHTETPEAAILRAEEESITNSLLYSAIDSLDKRHRKVLLVSMDSRYEEGAAKLHVSLGAYKSQLFRAKNLLKDELTKKGYVL